MTDATPVSFYLRRILFGSKRTIICPPPSPSVQKREGGPISAPSTCDVLCGRGNKVNSHEGNVRFRELVAKWKYHYMDKSNKNIVKAHIAAHVVNEIRYRQPAGRFLEKDQKNGMWFEIGDMKARKKAGQALRELNTCKNRSKKHDFVKWNKLEPTRAVHKVGDKNTIRWFPTIPTYDQFKCNENSMQGDRVKNFETPQNLGNFIVGQELSFDWIHGTSSYSTSRNTVNEISSEDNSNTFCGFESMEKDKGSISINHSYQEDLEICDSISVVSIDEERLLRAPLFASITCSDDASLCSSYSFQMIDLEDESGKKELDWIGSPHYHHLQIRDCDFSVLNHPANILDTSIPIFRTWKRIVKTITRGYTTLPRVSSDLSIDLLADREHRLNPRRFDGAQTSCTLHWTMKPENMKLIELRNRCVPFVASTLNSFRSDPSTTGRKLSHMFTAAAFERYVKSLFVAKHPSELMINRRRHSIHGT